MRRVVSLWFPGWSIERRRAARPERAGPDRAAAARAGAERTGAGPSGLPAEAGAGGPRAADGPGRAPDRHDAHYRREQANPFALSKTGEMERPGPGWSQAERGLQPAADRGPVWRAPKHREVPRPEARPRPGGADAGAAALQRVQRGWAAFQDAVGREQRAAAEAHGERGDERQGRPSQTQAMDRPRVVAAKADAYRHHQNAQLTERPRSPVSRTPDRPRVVGAAASSADVRVGADGGPLGSRRGGAGAQNGGVGGAPVSRASHRGEAVGPVAGADGVPSRRRAAEGLSSRAGPQAAPAGAAPLALVRKVGSRRLVHAACPAAQAAGVEPGQTVTQAQLLLPELVIEEADLEGDAAALLALARWAARTLSPLAAVDAPDGLLIDATGLAHLHGGEARMLAAFTAALRRLGFTARAAIADTPAAAWAWARFGPGGVLPPGEVTARLGPLPLAALRLADGTVDALAAVGVDCIAELEALPRAPAARRYGAALLQRLDQALGRAAEPIDPVAPPRLLNARLYFPEPLVTAEPLAEALRRLLAELCARLALGGLGARAFTLRFLRVDGAVQTLSAGTARPSRDPAHLRRLLAPRIETVDPGFGIEVALLIARRVEPLGPVQLGAESAAADGVAELVDRLGNRPETARIARSTPAPSDIPERSVAATDPLAPVTADGWPPELPRPARLIHPPEPVEALAMLPDHPPARFTWRGVTRRVVRADGPERLYGEWWRSPAEEASVRDYFQVEDEDGRRFWLFRDGDGEDPATGAMGWWCHGVFG